MRIYKSKPFSRFARKNEIADSKLCKAIHDAEQGLIDADLGGGVIKQRIARKGAGKPGGFRTLIVFRSGDRAIFLDGFAKNEAENIGPIELAALKKLAREMLGYELEELDRAVQSGFLEEVKSYGEDETVS